MSTEQLIADAMALPLTERVSLAQALWESLDAGLPDTEERAAINEAIQRDKELSSGRVFGRTHEEVMQAAREALQHPAAYRRTVYRTEHAHFFLFRLERNAEHFAQVVLIIVCLSSIDIPCLRHFIVPAQELIPLQPINNNRIIRAA